MATEKRYKVPDGMLEAAVEAWRMPGFDGFDDGLPHVAATNTTRMILEAALRWLAEHPVVPTDEQMYKLLGSSMVATDRFAVEHALIRWQRQMFIAPPEPEPEPIPGDDPAFLDNLLDYAAAHAPKGVDRIDVYAGAGVLIASRPVHPEPESGEPEPEPELASTPKAVRVSETGTVTGTVPGEGTPEASFARMNDVVRDTLNPGIPHDAPNPPHIWATYGGVERTAQAPVPPAAPAPSESTRYETVKEWAERAGLIKDGGWVVWPMDMRTFAGRYLTERMLVPRQSLNQAQESGTTSPTAVPTEPPPPPPPPPEPEASPAPQVAKCALFTSIDFGPRPRVRVTCDCGEFSTSFATTGDVAYDAARQADATRLGWQHIEDRVASIPEPTPAPPASPKGL